MKKYCTCCGGEKPESEFNRHKGKKDGLNSICRECGKARSKLYYKQNGDKHRLAVSERNKRVRRENRRQVLAYLKEHPCVDCGYNGNPAALDFDHVRGKKKFVISQGVSDRRRWDAILKEIGKCEVRCSNCHRIKTASDYGWYSDQGWGKGV